VDLQWATGVSDKTFILQPLSENTFEVDVSASLFNSGRVLLDILNANPELAYEMQCQKYSPVKAYGAVFR